MPKLEPNGGSPIARLQDHTFAGGEHTKSAFALLLGLERLPDRGETAVQIENVAWVRDRVEVALRSGTEEPKDYVVVIERFHPGHQGLAQSATLLVFLRQDRAPNHIVELLERAVRSRLGRLTMDQLAQIFAADPDLGASRYEAPPEVAEAREQEFDRQAFLFNWGGQDMWYQFFATAELSRHRLESLDLLEQATSVNHCDRECLANEPHIPLRVPLTNFPWDDRVRRAHSGRMTGFLASMGLPGLPDELRERVVSLLASGANREQVIAQVKAELEEARGGEAAAAPAPAEPPSPFQAHYTEMNDYDVIMGGQKKLEDVLNFAIDNVHGDMIFAHVTCIPAVTGEDVDSVIRKAQSRTDVPILTLTMTPDAKDVIFGPILLDKRKEAEAEAGDPIPGSVNLIGFPEGPDTQELLGLVSQAGVLVNAILLPRVELKVVKRLPNAPLHVLHPNQFWENLYNKLLFDTRIGSISPDAPFGYARTLKWLQTVTEAAGQDASRVPDLVAETWAPFEDDWERLREEASGYRLGFVLGSDQVHQLAYPAATWGVPLLPLLEEFGFGLDFMIYADDEEVGREAARELHKGLSMAKRHRFRLFQKPSELEELLRTGPFRAVYSEHFFDFRLSRAGKAQFSLNVFERGFGGAVRSLERLVEICRFPLYRRYGKYMGKSFPWARDPAPDEAESGQSDATGAAH